MKSPIKHKISQYLLYGSNLLLLTLVIFLLYRHDYFSLITQMTDNSSYDYKKNAQYTQRQTLFEALPVKQADIIFAGDSITARCEWQEFFPDETVLNRGIDSDVSEGLLNRLAVIIDAHPKKLYLMIGINDIRQKIPLTTTITNYETIIQTLQEALPDSTIYVQSILPVGKNTGMDVTEILKTNEELKTLSKKYHLTYIDIHSLLEDENHFLPETYSIDGVHLTGDGYRIWINAINALD